MSETLEDQVRRGVDALRMEGIFLVTFLVDGVSVQLIGHPSNAFPCSLIEVEGHLPWKVTEPARAKSFGELEGEVVRIVRGVNNRLRKEVSG